MEAEEIENELERELEGTGWSFKYWNKEDSFEFRNTGAALSEEDAEEKIDEFIEDLDELSHKPFLTGKLCLQKEDGRFIKKRIEEDGEVSNEGQEITEEEARDLLKQSLGRIDNDLIPTNRAVIDREEILEIYTENVRGLRMVTLNMKEEKMLTFRDDGGLQFETR